jgi:DUF971 family protein
VDGSGRSVVFCFLRRKKQKARVGPHFRRQRLQRAKKQAQIQEIAANGSFLLLNFTHTHITQSGQCEWLFTHLHRLCCCVAGVVVAYVMMPQFLYLKTQKGLREDVFCVVTLCVQQKISLSL